MPAKTAAPGGDAGTPPAKGFTVGAGSAFGKAPAAPGNDAGSPPGKAFGSTGFGSKAPAAPSGDAAAQPKGPFGAGIKMPTAQPAAAGGQPAAAGFAGFGAKKPAVAVPEKPKGPDIDKLPLLPADRYTGPLWDMPHFEKEEIDGRCTLLNKDGGFLKSIGKEKLRERLLHWVEKAKLYSAPIRYVTFTDPDEEIVRVIIKDSVRTFFHEDHRKKFTEFLFAARMEFGDYGQAMSYVAGLCMLVLNEQETMAVLRKCAKEYIPRHWAAEAVGFVTNAWLIEWVMGIQEPEVQKHFAKINFWPDTYMQKIISGLGVHILNFNQLFDFLDAFMAEGFTWLIKYELAIIAHFRQQLLGCTGNDMSTLFEIMRLDARAAEPEDHRSIYMIAKRMDLGDALDNLDIQRMTIYNEKVAPRLAAAPKEEAFEPCAICEEKKPKWWCDECELAICDDCHTGNKGDHKDGHAVEKW
jgi:hypothetical protein